MRPHYKAHYTALCAHAPGHAGDRTINLMWRLQNGELPQSKPPKAVVLLVGAHDLLALSVAGATEAALLAEVDPLLRR